MWRAFLINLVRNTRRLENSRQQFDAQRIAWERIDGVNGWEMPEHEIARVYDADANRRRGRHPLIAPEIGCYLSHIAAWRRIAAEPEGGFVFEDDFAAAPHLAEAMAALSADPARDWDMVKLFTFDAEAKTVSRRPLGPGELVHPYRVPSCLIGYGLTAEAAGRLADRAIPFFRPVDEDQKFFWETGLRVALALPAAIEVGDQEAATGTIGKDRRRANRKGLGPLLRGLRYQVRYSAALHRARRR